MVLDRGEDQYSNQDQDFEDDKETLYVQDMDNETHNDSEMMVSFFSIYAANYKQYL